jgi:adenylosuccinate lyase
MAHILTNPYYQNIWSTDEMRNVFTDRHRYQRWLDVEAALARVQARLGIIPQDAADEICKKAHLELLDVETLKKHLVQAQHTFVPLLKQLEKACDNGAGEFIHYGTATQDIQDTATSLELKDAFKIIFRDMVILEKKLIEMAQKHSSQPMVGRSNNQHTLPITVGLKAAGWAAEVRRNIERMKDMRKYIFVGLIHGSTGTMSGLGERAYEVAEGVLEELGLEMPACSWTGIRDNYGHFTVFLSQAAATISRITNEIYQLSRTEINEFSEPNSNPSVGDNRAKHSISAQVTSMCRIVVNNAPLALQAMIVEHERDTRSWRLDWHHIPENSILLSKALLDTIYLIDGLKINEHKIKKNLNLLNGQVLSDIIVSRLQKNAGRKLAEDLVNKCLLDAKNSKIAFNEILSSNEEIKNFMSKQEISNLFDYSNYTGQSARQIDEVINLSNSQSVNDSLFLTF